VHVVKAHKVQTVKVTLTLCLQVQILMTCHWPMRNEIRLQTFIVSH